MWVQAMRRSSLVRIAIDLRVTVICLALLFLLTLLGTFHQVSHGLYDAQQRYFGAWITLVGGIVPLPGAQLVLWVLFVNLVAVTAVRFVYRWSRVGILIIHLGMFVMFFGMFLRVLLRAGVVPAAAGGGMAQHQRGLSRVGGGGLA